MEKCKYCSADMPSSANFCPECGKAQDLTINQPNVVVSQQPASTPKSDDVFGFGDSPAGGEAFRFDNSHNQNADQPKNEFGFFGSSQSSSNHGGGQGNSQGNSQGQSGQGGGGQSTGFYQTNDHDLRVQQQNQLVTGANKKARFIFINCIVFMCFMVIRTIVAMTTIGSYSGHGDIESDLIAVYAVCLLLVALIVDACLIVMIIFSNKGRKPDISPNSQFKTGIVLLVVSIVNLVAIINYGVLDLFMGLIARTDSNAMFVAGSIFGVIVFQITFLIFAIINIVRAANYMREMKTASKML